MEIGAPRVWKKTPNAPGPVLYVQLPIFTSLCVPTRGTRPSVGVGLPDLAFAALPRGALPQTDIAQKTATLTRHSRLSLDGLDDLQVVIFTRRADSGLLTQRSVCLRG